MKSHLIAILAALILSQAAAGPDKSTFSARKKQRPDTTTLVTTQLTGVVTDPSGAVVPGAEVTLKLPDGTTRTTKTDNEGHYRFAQIAVGLTYALRISYPGFRVIELPNITVTPGSSSTVNMQFESGPSPSPNPSPSALPSPTASPNASPTPESQEAIIANEVQKLRESDIVFNPPREMQEQKPVKIEARISFRDIGSALSEGLEGPGTPESAKLKVSPIMRVTLTGDPSAFYIQGTEPEQIVAGKQFAQWEWSVTPLKSGDQTLTLTAIAVVNIPGTGEKTADHKSFEKAIAVHVDRWRALKGFFANNWQWLWTVLLVPGIGVIWKLRRGRSRKGRAGFR
jgi:hypothetical protein